MGTGSREQGDAGPGPGHEAWCLLADMVFSKENQARFAKACGAANLTPPLLKALLSLDADEAEPMRALAKGWGCDASWVTGIIDGLEERGYVERQVLATDRRVKVVQVTEVGEKAKARAMDCLQEPPAAIAALDVADQEALRDILRKVSAAGRRGSATTGAAPEA